MRYSPLFNAIIFCLCGFSAFVSAQEFNSGSKQVALVELYTSEGCSSCPPADRWLAKLHQDPKLWQSFVPVAFHVTYWNQLGWPDRFAQIRFDQRQRLYRQQRISSGVYTPGFFVAGHEWRQWFRGPRILPKTNTEVGNLQLKQQGRQVSIRFKPLQKSTKNYRVNLVLLADKIDNPIARGENKGKNLSHHFVALDWLQQNANQATSPLNWEFVLPVPKEKAGRYAVAAWISEANSPQALQAVGGWLDSP